MRDHMKIDLIIIILILVASVSCSTISIKNIEQIDQTLTVKEVQQNIDKYKGKMILWGGVIIETIHRPEETLIMVMQTNLDYEKRPSNLDQSEGRFIVKQSGFLDPVIFEKDRIITATGEVSGKEEFPLGEIRYVYPVITATQLILWEKRQYPPYRYDPWYWEPYPLWWPYPYYYPYYYHHHRRPHHRYR